jgi:hypothetical protein
MPQPTRYWRFSYDSEELLTQMLSAGALIVPMTGPRCTKYDPETCVATKIKVGDGVILGNLDANLGVGRIVAIGIVRIAKPVKKVEWQRIKRDVFPSPQGGIPAWRERCFLFSGEPAERYNLTNEFKVQFPNE